MGDRELLSAMGVLLKKQEAACIRSKLATERAASAMASASAIFQTLSNEAARASTFVSQKKLVGISPSEMLNADAYVSKIETALEHSGAALSKARDHFDAATRTSMAALVEKRRIEGVMDLCMRRISSETENRERKALEDAVASSRMARAIATKRERDSSGGNP